jgi:hypothetical protein
MPGVTDKSRVFRPFGACCAGSPYIPRLAPWAAFLRRFAAWSLWHILALAGEVIVAGNSRFLDCHDLRVAEIIFARNDRTSFTGEAINGRLW